MAVTAGSIAIRGTNVEGQTQTISFSVTDTDGTAVTFDQGGQDTLFVDGPFEIVDVFVNDVTATNTAELALERNGVETRNVFKYSQFGLAAPRLGGPIGFGPGQKRLRLIAQA